MLATFVALLATACGPACADGYVEVQDPMRVTWIPVYNPASKTTTVQPVFTFPSHCEARP